MTMSIFSLIMAVVWFDVFIIICFTLCRKTKFLLQFGLMPLIAACVLCILRIVLPLELPNAIVFRSKEWIPAAQSWLSSSVVLPGGLEATVVSIIVITCSIVSAILLIYLFASMYHTNRLCMESATDGDDRAQHIMQLIVNKTKPNQKFTLRLRDGINSPLTFGFFHPVILIPPDTLQLNDEQLRLVLMHEWTHFVSKDLFLKVFIKGLCSIMWWNPVVYLLRIDLDHVIELKCDHALAKQLDFEEQSEYLDAMLLVIRQAKERDKLAQTGAVPSLGFVKALKKMSVIQRFALIDNENKCPATWKSNLAFILVMAALFVASFSFVVQPYIEPVEDIASDVGKLSSYIVPLEDGTYEVFMDNKSFSITSKEYLSQPPLNTLPIIDLNGIE